MTIIFLNIPSNSPFLVLNMYCANVIFIFISLPLTVDAPISPCSAATGRYSTQMSSYGAINGASSVKDYKQLGLRVYKISITNISPNKCAFSSFIFKNKKKSQNVMKCFMEKDCWERENEFKSSKHDLCERDCD